VDPTVPGKGNPARPAVRLSPVILCFVGNLSRYAGKLAFEETAYRIARSAGDCGANIDYLANTLEKLDETGIEDRALYALLNRARAIG
jgi:cation transport regulator ChaC